MTVTYQYKVIRKNETDYQGRIIEFYQPRFPDSFSNKTLQTSSIICVALLNKEVIGAVRAISDFSRHALIVDLIVKKAHRGRGIGSKLLDLIVAELRQDGVRNISLVTEPDVQWLVSFYRKHGFAAKTGSVFMVYEQGINT